MTWIKTIPLVWIDCPRNLVSVSEFNPQDVFFRVRPSSNSKQIL